VLSKHTMSMKAIVVDNSTQDHRVPVLTLRARSERNPSGLFLFPVARNTREGETDDGY